MAHYENCLEKKRPIPSEWQRAVAVFIPEEMNSKDISQFRNILLNVEGKIFFSVIGPKDDHLPAREWLH